MKKIIAILLILISAPVLSCYDGLTDLYDNGRIYTVGESGPAGGIIAFVNPDYENDGWLYIEIAPNDEADSSWISARNACSSAAYGGFSDWELPDIENLQLIRSNLSGEFSSSDYWSSTEIDSSNAYILNFGGGLPTTSGKSSARKVRAMRKF